MRDADQNINIGDKATLLSGGPSMTIRGFEKEDSTPVARADRSFHGRDGLVRCVWFDRAGKINEHAFPTILLNVEPTGIDNHESGVQNAINRQDNPNYAGLMGINLGAPSGNPRGGAPDSV